MPSFSSIRSTPLSRTIAIEQQKLRALIWWFYRNPLAYKLGRSSCRKAQLKARSDRQQTGFTMLGRLRKRLHANKAELLPAPARPTRNSFAHQLTGKR